jgi:hypothetical protein
MVQAPVIMATTMVGDLAGDITWYFDGTAVTVVINACQSLAAGAFQKLPQIVMAGI